MGGMGGVGDENWRRLLFFDECMMTGVISCSRSSHCCPKESACILSSSDFARPKPPNARTPNTLFREQTVCMILPLPSPVAALPSLYKLLFLLHA